ncbi:MAG: NAD-dependent epimerase/dehydratase family protein [Candidatus Bathyarchaeia archaeon]|nr:NAD-dependent epimerase/dehydratase family protein [Candidatus Bathyarchaeia archaeon]
MFHWKENRVLVTGGAGFIGSCLCEKLASLGSYIVIFDNFSSGRYDNVEGVLKKYADKVCLLKGDCTRLSDVKKAVSDVDVVFHFAANPEVRLELNDPENCFEQNIYATHVLLEALRQNCHVEKVVFASTSTVYGDVNMFPTNESYGPLKPTSIYGASKLASEALINSYAYLYDFAAVVLRLANIIGPKSRHGVIPDFIKKLRKNKKELEILGDGTQRKSYLYIDDCANAILTLCEKSNSQVEIFNIGSEDWITVLRIAEIVVEEMGLKNVKFRFTGGVNGGRGWKGDIKKMLLDISKLKALGWKPKYKSEEAVRRVTKHILLIEGQ